MMKKIWDKANLKRVYATSVFDRRFSSYSNQIGAISLSEVAILAPEKIVQCNTLIVGNSGFYCLPLTGQQWGILTR